MRCGCKFCTATAHIVPIVRTAVKESPCFQDFFPKRCTVVTNCVMPCTVRISLFFQASNSLQMAPALFSFPKPARPALGSGFCCPGVPRGFFQHPPASSSILPASSQYPPSILHLAASPCVICLEQLIFAFVGFALQQLQMFVLACWLSVANTCSQLCDT